MHRNDNDNDSLMDPKFFEWRHSYQKSPKHVIFMLTELIDRLLSDEDDPYLNNVDCLKTWLYQITRVYREQLMVIVHPEVKAP